MPASVKLVIGAALVVGVTVYMAYVGASSSWKYYVTTDECLADLGAFVGPRLRVSGKVAPGSLRIDERRTRATFALAGVRGKLEVECSGPLPDNLAEEMDVVVEGRLTQNGRLQGDKVLTRCASKYEAAA
jgi:cytochrome c-type biogenesis protein CcmE